MDLDLLTGVLDEHGLPAFRRRQVLRAVQHEMVGSWDEVTTLPKELRAQIISIGIWILKEAERIRNGEVHSFNGIITVSEAICEGLK